MTVPANGATPFAAGSHPAFPAAWTGVRVTTAAEARALDDAAAARGIPPRALMRVAGHAIATEIARRYAHRLARGVAVYAGYGNNGGDAWVVAAALAASGVPVGVRSLGEPKTADARAERDEAVRHGFATPHGGEEIVVDGLLGVGATGPARGAIADAIAEIRARRAQGATIVSIDVPSGVNADTGEGYGERCVQAHCTLTLGTLKRGLLVARGQSGAIAVLDIGLGPLDGPDTMLADGRRVRAQLPPMPVSAHKGIRGKVLIVGGAPGMAG
ncbi:MAG: NAD(P)H-hydrate epimerase, partial [Gemmatimonadetes bacterium]|nr:NAD(P)H-hydrate epimerase [Gemmatimonadota bacterium]